MVRSLAAFAVPAAGMDLFLQQSNAGACSFIGEVKEFIGNDVTQTTYEGTTAEEQDASCCAACEAEPECEFWVRATDNSVCWLKKGFTSFAESSVRRGNFKAATTTTTTTTTTTPEPTPAPTPAPSCSFQQDKWTLDKNPIDKLPADSKEECCDVCRANPQCTHFTFTGDTCKLKTGTMELDDKPGYVSGEVSGPTPAPTPPTPWPTPVPVPTPSGGIPALPMKNAAKSGMEYPMMGLGVEGRGFKGGPSSLECWKWPQCKGAPQDAVVDYIQEAVSRGGVARIDTGYPYGDNADKGCPSSPPSLEGVVDIDEDEDFEPGDEAAGALVNLRGNSSLSVSGGHDSCDTYGHGLAIQRALKSGVKRDQLFVTIKVGYAGPMAKQDGQIKSAIKHLGLNYVDLCLIHLPQSGKNTGSHGQYCPTKDSKGNKNCHCASGRSDYDPKACRIYTYNSMLNNMKAGRCRAVGVANWNADHLKELEGHFTSGQLPSVVQYKFHLHNSAANSAVSDLIEFTKKHDIVFNGYAALGVPDWVTFKDTGMTAKLLDEPVVKAIAQKHSKTAAQVLLRWSVEQGFPTHARTMKKAHMKDNLDVFGFTLDSDDMSTLNSLPQCNVQVGNPYPDGSPDGGKRHGGVYGMTEHC